MNDEIEMVEEFQSENINDLILERKKKNAVQYFLTQSLSPTKYYHIDNYLNGDSVRSEIAPEYLDELGRKSKDSLSEIKHRSDSLFHTTIPMVCAMKEGLLTILLIEEVRQIWV